MWLAEKIGKCENILTIFSYKHTPTRNVSFNIDENTWVAALRPTQLFAEHSGASDFSLVFGIVRPKLWSHSMSKRIICKAKWHCDRHKLNTFSSTSSFQFRPHPLVEWNLQWHMKAAAFRGRVSTMKWDGRWCSGRFRIFISKLTNINYINSWQFPFESVRI